MHIASLAAHTTLNTYKPMEINIERGHLNTDVQAGFELGTLCSRERCLNRSATAPLNNLVVQPQLLIDWLLILIKECIYGLY